MRIFILFILLSYIPNMVFAQIKDVQRVTWHGIDFTHAKLIGSTVTDFTNVNDIVDTQFEGLNMLLLKEKKKYNFEKAIEKTVSYDISKAIELNKKVSKDSLVTLSVNKLTELDLSSIVSQYKTGSNEIGMLFVVENMRKADAHIGLYYVFFEENTGTILYKYYIDSKVTGGFGFRNWWASGFYSAINVIRQNYPNLGLK